MGSTAPQYGHLPLVPRCAICRDDIVPKAPTIALVGDKYNEVYRGRTPPFPFPEVGCMGEKCDGFVPCRKTICAECSSRTQTAPVHHNCFIVFIQRSPVEPKALASLWTVGCYQKPWPGAVFLQLQPDRSVNRLVLREFVHLSGFPPLPSLPAEIVESIRKLIPGALLWRVLSAIELADRLVAPPQPLRVLPLNDLVGWERGVPLAHVPGLQQPPAMRVEIDAHGIKKIERLSEMPTCQPDDSRDNLAYVVINGNEKAFADIRAHLQDRLLQLRIPWELSTPHIWSTPTSLAMGNCLLSKSLRCLTEHYLRVIKLHATRGITFFFSVASRILVDVHVHCESEPCAMSTYQRIWTKQQKYLVWIYLPIAPFDKVTAIGTRGVSEILIRTQLVGDIFVGMQDQRPDYPQLLGGTGERIAFVYGKPRESFHVPLMGSYCPAWESRDPPTLRPHEPDHQIYGPYFRRELCFSSASLDHVSSVSVFKDKKTGLCRGMLFKYENGGLRTVGQCRLDVDPNDIYAKPSRLCYGICRPYSHGALVGLQMAFPNEPEHEHSGDEEWHCHEFSGSLGFWFSHSVALVSISPAEEKEEEKKA